MKLTERNKCKNKCGIYIITNRISGSSYIGQATNIALRIYQHLHSAISEKASDYDYPLHRAFRKIGTDNFTFDILEECSADLLNEREQYWIAFYDTYKNGYNQTAGGYQSIRHIKLTKTDVEQIRNRLLNTEDSYALIASDYGICTDMVACINKGRCWNDSTIKYPLRNTRAIKIKNQLDTGYGIYQIDKKTSEVLNIFVSASQAALYLGGYEYCPHIVKCLAGKRKSAYGFYWETRPITEEQFKILLQQSKLSAEVKQLV